MSSADLAGAAPPSLAVHRTPVGRCTRTLTRGCPRYTVYICFSAARSFGRVRARGTHVRVPAVTGTSKSGSQRTRTPWSTNGFRKGTAASPVHNHRLGARLLLRMASSPGRLAPAPRPWRAMATPIRSAVRGAVGAALSQLPNRHHEPPAISRGSFGCRGLWANGAERAGGAAETRPPPRRPAARYSIRSLVCRPARPSRGGGASASRAPASRAPAAQRMPGHEDGAGAREVHRLAGSDAPSGPAGRGRGGWKMAWPSGPSAVVVALPRLPGLLSDDDHQLCHHRHHRHHRHQIQFCSRAPIPRRSSSLSLTRRPGSSWRRWVRAWSPPPIRPAHPAIPASLLPRAGLVPAQSARPTGPRVASRRRGGPREPSSRQRTRGVGRAPADPRRAGVGVWLGSRGLGKH